jgi:hypothetical protein
MGSGKLHQVAGLIKAAEPGRNQIEPVSSPADRPGAPALGQQGHQQKQMNSAPGQCTKVGMIHASSHSKSPADVRSTS